MKTTTKVSPQFSWKPEMIMNTNMYTGKNLSKYIRWVFILAWVMQIAVWMLYQNGGRAEGQLLMGIMMYMPLIAVLISGVKLKGMGWKPKLKGNIGILLFSWFAPSILTLIGAAIYFAIWLFPVSSSPANKTCL